MTRRRRISWQPTRLQQYAFEDHLSGHFCLLPPPERDRPDDAAEANLKMQAVEEDSQDRWITDSCSPMCSAPLPPRRRSTTCKRWSARKKSPAATWRRNSGLPPQTTYHVQDVNELKMPAELAESVDVAIDRALGSDRISKHSWPSCARTMQPLNRRNQDTIRRSTSAVMAA